MRKRTSNRTINRVIGQRLKRAREDAKLTQSEAAEIMSNHYNCNMDERTIRRYEVGDNSVSIENLLNFADLYNKTLDYLVYGHNTTNDDSIRWEDMLKRLNRLINTGVLIPQKISDTNSNLNGKYQFIALDPETNVYLDQIHAICAIDNYHFNKGEYKYDKLSKDCDDAISKVVDKTENVPLTMERIINFFLMNKEDPTNFVNNALEKSNIIREKKKNETE